MSERILSPRELNRALLARQLLLERAKTPLPRALERVGGIQAQYAPSMYIGLWSRVEGFRRDALTRTGGRPPGPGDAHALHHPPGLCPRTTGRSRWAVRAGPAGVVDHSEPQGARHGARRMAAAARRMRARLAATDRCAAGRSMSCSGATARRRWACGSTWCGCRRRARGSGAAPISYGARRDTGSARPEVTRGEGARAARAPLPAAASARPRADDIANWAGPASRRRLAPRAEAPRAAPLPRRGRRRS